MSFLLKVRFDETGCSTDNGITSISNSEDVNIYTQPSPLKNGKKCVYFPPYTYSAGLMRENTNISIPENGEFTIYLKYKIDRNLLDKEYDIPILSYSYKKDILTEPDLNLIDLYFGDDPSNNTVEPNKSIASISENYNYFLFIQEGKYFSLLLNKQEGFSSVIEYTFDNKWHTLCITRDKENVLRFFVDGHVSTENKTEGTAIEISNTLYIGKYKPSNDIAVNLDGACLDDICILDTCVYTDNFIPPTMYFNGTDTKENYKYYNFSNTDNVSKVIQDAVEEKMFSTATHINNRQMGWLPRRLRIRWYEHSRQYFRNEEYYWTKPRPDATILNIYGLEIPYIYGYDRYRFMEGNAYRLWQENKIAPFLLFINKEFVKLTDIDMVKSDWWLTFFIRGRDPRFNPKVESVDIIIIPFPIIYEEGLGEREDLHPLYSFNEKGLFDSSNGYSFFYVDKSKAPPGLTDIGIQDQYIPTVEEENNQDDSADTYNDGMFMHNIWRYGTLTQQSVDGKSAIYKFNSMNDDKYVQPGDQVTLYMRTLHISTERYRIVGNDLLEFYDYESDNIEDNTVFTMQMVTDNRDWQLQDLTNTRFVQVVAEVDNQSVFEIPEVVDSDGYSYRYFLIFRGSVCILNTDRFIISDDYKTLTFTNTEDFVPKGTCLYFVFVKILKADQFGPLHVKPIFLDAVVDPDTTGNFGESFTYSINIPDLHSLEYNVNNVMLFIQNTLISPERYEIQDNVLRLTKYTGDTFLRGKHAVFVLLKMVNRFEDPIDDHDRVVYEEIQRGRRYVLYELPINKYRQITIDNFVTFDNKGYYISNLFGEVMNRNIIKELHTDDPLRVVPRYLTCVYSTDSLPNEANTLIPTNDDFVSQYITLRQEYYELDDHFEEFMSDFDVSYSKSVHYGQNLARALDYIVCYNQNKLDRAYERTTLVERYTYDTKHFIEMLQPIDNKGYDLRLIDLFFANDRPGNYPPNVYEDEIFYVKQNVLRYYQFYTQGTESQYPEETIFETELNWYMELDREVYQDRYYDSFPIYFQNGLVPIWYQFMLYENNRMTVRMKDLPLETDTIELFYFRKIHNFLEPLENMIRFLEPIRVEEDIDGSVEIELQKVDDTLPNFNINGLFEYVKSGFSRDILDSIVKLDPFYIDENDPKHNIDGTVTIGLTPVDNTKPNYNIDGMFEIQNNQFTEDINGYLEMDYIYKKENVIHGYEFIKNTYVDTSRFSIIIGYYLNLYQKDFMYTGEESDNPELGQYQFKYTHTFEKTMVSMSPLDEFVTNGYLNGYECETSLSGRFTDFDNVELSDYDLTLPLQPTGTLSYIPLTIELSFYTNEDPNTYKVPRMSTGYIGFDVSILTNHGIEKHSTGYISVLIMEDPHYDTEYDLLDGSVTIDRTELDDEYINDHCTINGTIDNITGIYDLNLVSLEFGINVDYKLDIDMRTHYNPRSGSLDYYKSNYEGKQRQITDEYIDITEVNGKLSAYEIRDLLIDNQNTVFWNPIQVDSSNITNVTVSPGYYINSNRLTLNVQFTLNYPVVNSAEDVDEVKIENGIRIGYIYCDLNIKITDKNGVTWETPIESEADPGELDNRTPVTIIIENI